MNDLLETIISHEGQNRFAYADSEGFLTIGVGRNIDEKCGRGLSDEEILFLLKNDINLCKLQLEGRDIYMGLDKVRQEVLIELCFNLGLPRLLLFHSMLAHLKNKDYVLASLELNTSLWAKQVSPERVANVSYRLVHGKYP